MVEALLHGTVAHGGGQAAPVQAGGEREVSSRAGQGRAGQGRAGQGGVGVAAALQEAAEGAVSSRRQGPSPALSVHW